MKKHLYALGLLAACTSSAHAALLTDPNDARSWQGATVGTFASIIYGADTAANRSAVIANGFLDDGTFNTSGVGTGSYYGNNMGCSGYSTLGGGYGYSCGTESLATYTDRANKLDWNWIQDLGDGGSSWLDGNVWDLGGSANKVVVFPIVDHGPLPLEAWEYTVYLSNNPFATSVGSDGNTQWVQAQLVTLYLEGWNSSEIADGFTTVWQLPTADEFRYTLVVAGGAGAPHRDGDDEIDAVAGLHFNNNPSNPVPEPESLALLGLGLMGLVAAKRAKKKA